MEYRPWTGAGAVDIAIPCGRFSAVSVVIGSSRERIVSIDHQQYTSVTCSVCLCGGGGGDDDCPAPGEG